MVALWILLGIAALIAFLLIAPLHIYLSYRPETGFAFQLRYLFLRLPARRQPQTPKPAVKKSKAPKKAEKKKSGGGIVAAFLDFLGLSSISSAANARRTIDAVGVVGLLREVTGVLRAIFARTGRLLKKGVFHRFSLSILCGGDDAADVAMAYGHICAALYPLMGLLEQTMRMRQPRTGVTCDYEAPAVAVTFDGHLVYRPCHFVSYFFWFVGRYLKNKLRKGRSAA